MFGWVWIGIELIMNIDIKRLDVGVKLKIVLELWGRESYKK